MSVRTPRIALVHDWLTGMRGGERALEVLCERFPGAEIFTLLHVPGSVSRAIEERTIHRSFVQALPFAHRRYRQYLPIFPAAIESLDVDNFDLVVSLSHCAAKSIVRTGRARHLCYCLTPMRYAWDQFDAYFGRERVGPFSHALMRSAMAWLARWDRDTSARADRYVAISHYVAGRIRRYYNREATVVYPPVDTAFFQPADAAAGRNALIVSALVPYKRIDLGIEACRRAHVPLTIVGDGPDRARLEAAAAGTATFLGRLGDREVRDAYRQAAVVLLPGEEDFGIVPLEAQACGRPVVALARGGALETIVDGETGTLVKDQTAGAFAEAIAATVETTFDRGVIRRHAEQFGRERFGDRMQAIVEELAGEVPATDRTW